MNEERKQKIRRVVSTSLLTAIALVVGIGIGINQAGGNGFLNLARTNAANDVSKTVNLDQFWKVWNMLDERHPDGMDVTTQEKVWGAISGLVESVGDPYTVFLPPKENEALSIDLAGKFSGVGMEVGMRDGNITVIAPLKDSPAERAGVLSGDVILKIDDAIATDLDIDQAVDLIRGPENTSVTITIAREGESATRDITMKREVIVIPVLETEKLVADQTFVIRLFSFGEDSAEEFANALKEFQASGYDRLIVDLRNNPGGFLSAAVDISSWFLEPGQVVVTEEAKDETENAVYKSGGHTMEGNYKMVVLVNGGSASASEIMAGALQEHKRAKLVGTQTFGKGSVQELIPMVNGTALKLTIAKWLTPNGKSISKEGLKPDVVVEFDDAKYEKDKTDTQLQKAIEILKGK